MRLLCFSSPREWEYVYLSLAEGLRELGVELAFTGDDLEPSLARDEAILRSARDADGVVVFAHKHVPLPRRLLPRIRAARPGLPVVFVDGSEWSVSGFPTIWQVESSRRDPAKRRGVEHFDRAMLDLVGPGRYLKRECYAEDLAIGIRPFPYALASRHLSQRGAGSPPATVPFRDPSPRTLFPRVAGLGPRNVDVVERPQTACEREIDVLCSFGQTTTGLRLEAEAVCRELAHARPDLRVVVNGSMSPAAYRDALERSRIVIDAWGGGDWCERFFEGIGALACVAAQRHRIVSHHPFVDGRDVVGWSSAEELRARLLDLADDRDQADSIAARGYAHAMTHHSAVCRAREVLQALGLESKSKLSESPKSSGGRGSSSEPGSLDTRVTL